MDDVPSAILKLARMYPVKRIILGRFCGPYIDVNCGHSRVSGHAVQPDLCRLDRRFGVTEVEKGPR